MVEKKQLARRVRDQWAPAASPVLSGVSTDARASLFTAFLADRLTGSRTQWFNENKTGSKMHSAMQSTKIKGPLIAGLAVLAGAIITGLAFAGWLNLAPGIFLTLAQTGLAWCF
ncbi:MAG: hypothetical protein P1V21_14880 [Rhizobiaceae bacterium]|nr:hypothetical protein [Rhizobiaceae bacterium]